MKLNSNAAFTLLEILVAVLIIGILGAIVVPQYQRAVLKSRYASLMPIAKSMADSNEAYYLEHGIYADNAQDLPVQGRQNYPDGTELEFGTTTDYAYVLASNPSVEHNTYIVYQKHSKNFADTTQCEALTADEKANQVCTSFGGTPLDGSISGEEYTAYLLSGNGSGTFEKECKGAFATEKTCPSGCGVMTRDSASCNTTTGQWTEDGFDEDECPQPLETETEDCPAGYLGQRSRQGNVCQNGTYVYGPWSQCQVDACYNATNCNDGVPTACKSGYYLNNGSCKACGTGAASCNSNGQATSCQARYALYQGNCYSCSAHTVTCVYSYQYNQTQSQSCDPGYLVINSGAITCQPCSTYYGTGATSCISAPYGGKNVTYGAMTCASGYHIEQIHYSGGNTMQKCARNS